MSILFDPLIPPRRRFWGQLFGRAIQGAREKRNRSVEETAQLAGIEAFEWAAIEAGEVPINPRRVHAMAAALDMREDQISLLARVCREAWSR